MEAERVSSLVKLKFFFLGEWKDHEYRSGNDNWNNRRGRNVQSNIRDYEIDDTRVYDYEKDDDDDEQVNTVVCV